MKALIYVPLAWRGRLLEASRTEALHSQVKLSLGKVCLQIEKVAWF